MANDEAEIRAELEAMAKSMVEGFDSDPSTLKLEEFTKSSKEYAAIYSWHSIRYSTVKVKFSIYIEDDCENLMSVEPMISPELAHLLKRIQER